MKKDRIPVAPLPLRYKALKAMISEAVQRISQITIASEDPCSVYIEPVLEHAYLYAKKVAEYPR